LDNAIDTASRLPPEQQEMLVEILRRRHLEARRLEIATDARQAIAMFRDGILKPQSVAEAMADLPMIQIAHRPIGPDHPPFVIA
jgi:hypothetical protein